MGTMLTADDVSVIVPTFNRSSFLDEALATVSDQTTPPGEVICLDDGSTDDTADVVARFGDRVIYCRQENAGKSVALNNALSFAKGRAIWIFDDDDVAEPDALARMVAALNDHPEAMFVYGDYDVFHEGEGPRVYKSPKPPRVQPEEIFLSSLYRSFIHQPGLLVRREAYDAVGPFDETLLRSQDLDMVLRLAQRFPGVHAPGIFFHQRHHTGTRGTRDKPIDPEAVKAAWRRYNRMIYEKIHGRFDLDDYVIGRSITDDEPRDLFLAHLTRFSIFARRLIWDLALADLQAAARLSKEIGITTLTEEERRRLYPTLDAYGEALEAVATDPVLTDALSAFDQPLQADIRGTLLQPAIGTSVHAARTFDKERLAQVRAVYGRLGAKGGLRHHMRDVPWSTGKVIKDLIVRK